MSDKDVDRIPEKEDDSVYESGTVFRVDCPEYEKWHKERDEKLGAPLADNLVTFFLQEPFLDSDIGEESGSEYMVIVAEHTLGQPVQGGDIERWYDSDREIFLPITHIWTRVLAGSEIDREINEITVDFHDYKSWHSINTEPDSYLSSKEIDSDTLEHYRKEGKYPDFMKCYDGSGYIYTIEDFHKFLLAKEYNSVIPSFIPDDGLPF